MALDLGPVSVLELALDRWRLAVAEGAAVVDHLA